MGFFSWKTADTKKPINNVHSRKPTKQVYLLQPNGLPPIAEFHYDGYGIFGDVDAYEWLAKMNVPDKIEGMGTSEAREIGINLQYHHTGVINYPLKFSKRKNAIYEDLPASQDDPDQGYFF